MLAIHSFLNGYTKKGAEAQLAADTPIINACKLDRDTAVKANVSLQTDVARIGAERDQQSAAVKDLQAAMAARDAEKVKRQTADRPRIAALQADSGTLEQRLAANTEGKTCDEKLSNVDRDLRAIVGGGVRVVTPAAGSRDANQNPPARPGPGKGVLRLSQ
jgi:hypothetical protein